MDYITTSERKEQYTPHHNFVVTKHVRNLDTVNKAFLKPSNFVSGQNGDENTQTTDETIAAVLGLTISRACAKRTAEKLFHFP